MTAVVICVSQASDNASQTRFALEFGEQFSKLCHRTKKAPVEGLEKVRKHAVKVLVESEAVLLDKKKKRREKKEVDGKKGMAEEDMFTVVRQALVRDSKHILDVLERLESMDITTTTNTTTDSVVGDSNGIGIDDGSSNV